jgi:hypothetical protein
LRRPTVTVSPLPSRRSASLTRRIIGCLVTREQLPRNALKKSEHFGGEP